MNRTFLALGAAAATLLPGLGAAKAPAPPPQVIGTWINPRGSVKVQTGACAGARADSLCGWVVWAAPQAVADARDGGTARLVGTELLRGYRSAGPGLYRGKVYVPDMGRIFASTIEQHDPDNLKISGCILGGLVCRSQVWHRA